MVTKKMCNCNLVVVGLDRITFSVNRTLPLYPGVNDLRIDCLR